jgi:hypothetical protein
VSLFTCLRRHALLVLLVGFVAACTSSDPRTAPSLTAPLAEGTTVLLLRPAIACQEVQVGGTVPRPDWVARAEASVGAALEAHFADRSTVLVAFEPERFPSERREAQAEAASLLTRVGGVRLPAAQPGAQPSRVDSATLSVLREDYAADYALAVFLQESYQSAGHVAMRYGLGLFLGPVLAPMPGTGQSGFATLTDLSTGEVVWSNTIMTPGEVPTDIRDPDKARKAVEKLLDGCPA